MTLKRLIPGLCLTLTLSGCIQDEALNVEAAIDGCTGKGILSVNIQNEPETDKEVFILVEESSNLSATELQFTLPEGATIKAETPADADNPPVYDFGHTSTRNFIVTAEDGTTQAIFRVHVNKVPLPTSFSFENLSQREPYHIFYATDRQGIIQWSSGNPGFALTGMASSPEDFPTTQMDGGIQSTHCVKLETKDTGSFGSMVGMPIAAGNLFIGSFDVSNALKEPLAATRFGYTFTQKPNRFTGYYKYKSGGESTDKSGQPTNETDRGDIYAVFYKAPSSDFTLAGDVFPLDGSINPNVILMARIPQTEETDTWTRFDLPFELQNGFTLADIDEQDLADGKYKLSVVFSSSIKGGYFIGAVGSTLWIDEVNIECE